MIYTKDNITNSNSKDGYFEDNISFTIYCVCDKYFESLEIANIIRSIFEKKKIIDNGMIINDCKMTGIDEAFDDNAYIQKLNFECNMTK